LLTNVKTVFCELGSVEDEYGDGVAKLAKLRPMRVEMYGMNWNRWLGNNSPRSIRTDAIHRVSPNDQNPFQFIPYIAADSGERTSLEMILAVLKKVESW